MKQVGQYRVGDSMDAVVISKTTGFAGSHGRLLYHVSYAQYEGIDEEEGLPVYICNKSEIFETEIEAKMAAEIRLTFEPFQTSSMSTFNIDLGRTIGRADNFRFYKHFVAQYDHIMTYKLVPRN